MTLLLRTSPDQLNFLSSKEIEADNTNLHIQATARMRYVYFLLPKFPGRNWGLKRRITHFRLHL
jgi:hypothetical protein